MCQPKGQHSGQWKVRGSEIFVRSEEAQIGKRVRVSKDHLKATLRGREGTITHSWGNPGYPALDVLLDEGDWQLFWYHELEPMDEDVRSVHDAKAEPQTRGPSPD
jgi:hypothetical protein